MAANWDEHKDSIMSEIFPQLQTGDKLFTGELSKDQAAEELNRAWNEDQGGEDQTSAAEQFSREIVRIGLRMGLYSHGVDFLIDNGAPQKMIDEYEQMRWEAVAKEAARRLGLSDYRPLMLKDTRTKEQEKLMAEISAHASFQRLFNYLESNYHRATLRVMADMAEGLSMGLIDDMSKRDDWEDISSTIAFLTRYFFALHGQLRAEGVDEIDPASPRNLSDDQEAELTELTKRLLSYRAEHGGGFYENLRPCFALDGMAAAEVLTEFSKRDDIFLPVAKAWRRQHDIAFRGAKGLTVGVGGNVDIKVTISDKEGNPLQLDGIRRGAQMAIGNLIDNPANGGRLPIVVTPDQVYREWAGLDSDVDITDQQAAKMEAAIDSLTSSPSKMDFEEQLKEHAIKKKARDYDYTGPNAGRLSGNLITAEKIEAVRKNGSRTVAYKVFSYPMLYRYSHVVGQIAQVKRSLITGGEKPAIKQDNKWGAQYNSRDVSMRHNVLTRIERMKAAKDEARSILLSQVAEDLIIPLTDKTERTLRKNLEIYLEELRAQGEIKGFSPKMGGRANRKFIGFGILV